MRNVAFFGPLAALSSAAAALLVAPGMYGRADAGVSEAPPPTTSCSSDGRLQAEIYGALAGSLDWSAIELECSGMPRPNGEGARLRFFSTWDLDSCWTDITTHEPVADSGNRCRIAGTLYCVAPFPEVNGDASVSISELNFVGRLDWSAK